MDHAGHLVPRYKIRTKKRVIRAIVDQMVNEGKTLHLREKMQGFFSSV